MPQKLPSSPDIYILYSRTMLPNVRSVFNCSVDQPAVRNAKKSCAAAAATTTTVVLPRKFCEEMIEGGAPSALAQRCNMCWQVRRVDSTQEN